jgi:hypothetical protein
MGELTSRRVRSTGETFVLSSPRFQGERGPRTLDSIELHRRACHAYIWARDPTSTGTRRLLEQTLAFLASPRLSVGRWGQQG